MNNLPKSFVHVKLELAREREHPVGDTEHGYDILVPLLADGTIDVELAAKYSENCRVRRFRRNEKDKVGKLLQNPDGSFYIDYDETRNDDDEKTFNFEFEHFVRGEYVSIKEDDGIMHPFLVMNVSEI